MRAEAARAQQSAGSPPPRTRSACGVARGANVGASEGLPLALRVSDSVSARVSLTTNVSLGFSYRSLVFVLPPHKRTLVNNSF